MSKIPSLGLLYLDYLQVPLRSDLISHPTKGHFFYQTGFFFRSMPYFLSSYISPESKIKCPRDGRLCKKVCAVKQFIRTIFNYSYLEFTSLGYIGKSIVRIILHIIPHSLRAALYGRLLNNPSVQDLTSRVRYLPFGLCLKACPSRSTIENEENVLLVEKYTDILAPRFMDTAPSKDGNKDFLLMTRTPGEPMDRVAYRMSNKEQTQVGWDLKKCISQLRRIPNDSGHLIANLHGGLIFDSRFIDGDLVGPFDSIKEFADYLTHEFDPKVRNETPIATLYKKNYKVFFSHSDLHQGNILVKAGKFSGIIDWEYAGFKPEYWEYTKGLRIYNADKLSRMVLDRAFDESYSEELDAESSLWTLDPRL